MDIQNFTQSIIPWFYSSGIKIIAILIGAFLANKIGKIFIEKKEEKIPLSRSSITF